MLSNSNDYWYQYLMMDNFYYSTEIAYITEIAKNRLYFAVLEGEDNKVIKNTSDTLYFSIDDELRYMNYYLDFGPLNISCLYKYCYKLNNFLHSKPRPKRVVHYTTSDANKRVNAALLMGGYAIIYLKVQPKDAYRLLLNSGGPFKCFIDASQTMSPYSIRIIDCLQAIEKALAFNFFNFNDFNMGEYDMHDTLQNGDMNWIVPRKFLAFIGPIDSEVRYGHAPDFYLSYFMKNDVRTVIRLNSKVYDASVFTSVGIEHHDLFFPDGSVPPKNILLKFLDISEKSPAAIAVHCKAGLGRTGSLIGAYIMKHYRMTAREAIAWMRLCRPGSVIGQQQVWLEKIESWLWRQGSQYRLHHFGEGDKIPHHKYGIYSKEWPKERDKLIRQMHRNNLEASFQYKNRSRSPTKSAMVRGEDSVQSTRTMVNPTQHHEPIRKKTLQNEKSQELTQIVKMLSNSQKSSATNKYHSNIAYENMSVLGVQKDKAVGDRLTSADVQNVPKFLNASAYGKPDESTQEERLHQMKINRLITTAPNCYKKPMHDMMSCSTCAQSIQTQNSFRNQGYTQADSRKLREAEVFVKDNVKKQFVNSAIVEPSQGDKLNEIKAIRYKSSGKSQVGNLKDKQIIKISTNNPQAAVGIEQRASFKKEKIQPISLAKPSYFINMYPST